MTNERLIAVDEDPVCGMRIDSTKVKVEGLHLVLEGRSYAFCGELCRDAFQADPAWFLDLAYRPTRL